MDKIISGPHFKPPHTLTESYGSAGLEIIDLFFLKLSHRPSPPFFYYGSEDLLWCLFPCVLFVELTTWNNGPNQQQQKLYENCINERDLPGWYRTWFVIYLRYLAQVTGRYSQKMLLEILCFTEMHSYNVVLNTSRVEKRTVYILWLHYQMWRNSLPPMLNVRLCTADEQICGFSDDKQKCKKNVHVQTVKLIKGCPLFSRASNRIGECTQDVWIKMKNADVNMIVRIHFVFSLCAHGVIVSIS